MNFSRNTNISWATGSKTTQFGAKFVPNICVTSERVGTMCVTRRDIVTLRVTITQGRAAIEAITRTLQRTQRYRQRPPASWETLTKSLLVQFSQSFPLNKIGLWAARAGPALSCWDKLFIGLVWQVIITQKIKTESRKIKQNVGTRETAKLQRNTWIYESSEILSCVLCSLRFCWVDKNKF